MVPSQGLIPGGYVPPHTPLPVACVFSSGGVFSLTAGANAAALAAHNEKARSLDPAHEEPHGSTLSMTPAIKCHPQGLVTVKLYFGWILCE